MSLVDSSHIVPAPRGRHGAHYRLIGGKPGMTMYPTQFTKRLCPYCGEVDYETKYDDGNCLKCKKFIGDVPWQTHDIGVKDKIR